MSNLRDEVFAKAKDKKTATKKSWAWYENNVRNAAAGMSAQKFLGDNIAYQDTSIVPGSMIQYFYDPKTKEKLPYYDTFPLLLPFSVTDKHFMGLNLHYLPPLVRALLLDQLMKYIDDDKLSSKAKLQLSWETLKGAANDKIIGACVKKYLFGQVKSNYIVIPPNEWEYVVWLPLERFKKANNETVWSKV